jgi:glutaredoxin
MPTICPKCRTLRPADTTVPDWQCPACGVAYAKAGGDALAVPAVRRAQAAQAAVASDGLLASVPWGKLLACAAIVYGAWLGFHRSGAGTGAGSSRLGANLTVEQLAQLAASSQPSDVLMYSATWCPSCSAAKSWMGQYGFKAQVCEIDKDSDCLSQLKALDPQGGVPYVIVKGHHMKDGFNSDEFVAALAK